MRKKVFVSGCFDMLHSGHVAFLQEAAGFGDLYVGIGSDRTVYDLKKRRPINSESERLFMLKALSCVKDAWVSSGAGLMDFENEVRKLKPDIFFVNTDGSSPAKEAFCRELGIQLIVSQRRPYEGLPVRSTTALRAACNLPYRIELCGGWLDQPCVNELCPGSVITLQIAPTADFNTHSGLATSSRNHAIKLWQGQMPVGNREELAKILFCVENPPGHAYLSGAQDQLGILLPGLNRLHFANGYWPDHIDSCRSEEILHFVQQHLFLRPVSPRASQYRANEGRNLSRCAAQNLAQSAEDCWQAIMNQDAAAWGDATSRCLAAQLAMFPNMATPEMREAIDSYRGRIYGAKVTGAGGGGYLVLISEEPVSDALSIVPTLV